MSDLSANLTTTPFIIHSNLIVPKIAIIGGGLTGLLTATLLERAFAEQSEQANAKNSRVDITIFEKSRSIGRLATRYRTHENVDTDQHWQWAFGAQFFTAKSDSFSQFIAPWLDSELLQPWCAQVVDLISATDDKQQATIHNKEQWNSSQARYISTPKMTSWGRDMADHLHSTTVKFKTRIAPLTKPKTNDLQQHTELFDDNGASLGHFDWVICTIPNGQAVDLIADSGFSEQAKIIQPKMLACYTLMLGWDSLEELPESLNAYSSSAWDVAYPQDSILAKIFVEHHKPNHDQLLPSVTIHASNDWSEAHVDEDVKDIQAQLLIAAQQALNWNNDTAPSQIDCHRWRYAATVVDSDKEELGILVDKARHLIVSGDWCGQGNIESCYRMAVDTVEVVAGVLNQ